MTNAKETLLNILSCYLTNTSIKDSNIDFDSLYELSNALNVSTIVAYTLNKNNIKNTNFDKVLYKTVLRLEKYKSVVNDLSNELNNKYDYLFIKGITLAKYYEEEYLRYSSDIDVVIKDNYEDALKYTLNNGYKCIYTNRQESLLVKNNIQVDFHRHFFNRDEFENTFVNCFNETHELDINYKYLYLLVHILKHFRNGKLELRFFIDLYHIRDLVDKDVISKLIKDNNLELFNDNMNHYLDVLMGKADYNDLDHFIENFIFEYALDSGNRNRVLINSYGKKGLKYVFSRIFISKELLTYEYPILAKYKLFLPVFYVVRAFRPLLTNRRKYVLNEVKNSRISSSSDINEMHEKMLKIGAIKE